MDIEEIKDFRPLILVAEDDDSNFKLIKAIIGKKCDILWAKNGEEMLNLYREHTQDCLLYTSPSPRDRTRSRMPSSA